MIISAFIRFFKVELVEVLVFRDVLSRQSINTTVGHRALDFRDETRVGSTTFNSVTVVSLSQTAAVCFSYYQKTCLKYHFLSLLSNHFRSRIIVQSTYIGDIISIHVSNLEKQLTKYRQVLRLACAFFIRFCYNNSEILGFSFVYHK